MFLFSIDFHRPIFRPRVPPPISHAPKPWSQFLVDNALFGHSAHLAASRASPSAAVSAFNSSPFLHSRPPSQLIADTQRSPGANSSHVRPALRSRHTHRHNSPLKVPPRTQQKPISSPNIKPTLDTRPVSLLPTDHSTIQDVRFTMTC
ncbi:unnamed protein product [Protopolystoma xenopodis]|uniref:Uncharacterized protein n=1 Tax=Protopolystoma xenopodis TaxID=117903 RepID=A0A3S5AJY2_9PLAT|nr:unnamed protein product [Protopolystoma xenopodis]